MHTDIVLLVSNACFFCQSYVAERGESAVELVMHHVSARCRGHAGYPSCTVQSVSVLADDAGGDDEQVGELELPVPVACDPLMPRRVV